MSDEKVLTKDIAEQFLADEDSVDLSEFTAIENGAAEVLSKHDGGIELDGLTSLSDVAAASFGKFKGEDLSLDGLASLSNVVAESLSKYCGGLRLCGLTMLSDSSAKSLSKKQGGYVMLEGLMFMSSNAKTMLQNATAEIDYDFALALPDFTSMHEVQKHFSDVELTN